MENKGNALIEKLVHINRVSKVVKGGRRFSFSALVVVGDGVSRVGFGHAKAQEVSSAVKKATVKASNSMVKIPLKEGRTLHHDANGKFGAGEVMLRSAPTGTGVIAGGPMRAVLEALGISDVVAKSLRSTNPFNMVRATFDALTSTMSPRMVAVRRGLKVTDILSRRNLVVGHKFAEIDDKNVQEDEIAVAVNEGLNEKTKVNFVKPTKVVNKNSKTKSDESKDSNKSDGA